MTRQIEGKTKIIEPLEGMRFGLVHSKDDITAADGAKHHVLPGKGVLANATTCHVFDLLQTKGVPLAYVEREGDMFLTQLVDMIPVEIVVRNEAAGSYCKRNPDVPTGTQFEEPVVEFYYKTSGKDFFGTSIEVDDPLMRFSEDGDRITLHHPGRPIDSNDPMLVVRNDQIQIVGYDRIMLFGQLQLCMKRALDVNTHLKQAWAHQGGRLIDFKIECGVARDGTIVVADVIDCDSWRVIWNEMQLSKQKYRDGADLDAVLQVYQEAERLTRNFVHS